MTAQDAILQDARRRGDGLEINLWYPDAEDDTIRNFIIGLVDVRAADDIRVSYDKKRDGWKIEQASTFSWDAADKVCDPDWQEVAFVKAWARRKSPTAVHEAGKGDRRRRRCNKYCTAKQLESNEKRWRNNTITTRADARATVGSQAKAAILPAGPRNALSPLP